MPARVSGGAGGAARSGDGCCRCRSSGSRPLSPGSLRVRAAAPRRDAQPCAGLRAASPPALPHGPCGDSRHPVRLLGSVRCTGAFGFVSPSGKWESRGWRWLRPRSRLGRAVMQTERHRESCSEGSGRILTCLPSCHGLKALPSPLRAQSSNAAAQLGDAGAVRRLRESVRREGELDPGSLARLSSTAAPRSQRLPGLGVFRQP